MGEKGMKEYVGNMWYDIMMDFMHCMSPTFMLI
jgi:hypothetical protein